MQRKTRDLDYGEVLMLFVAVVMVFVSAFVVFASDADAKDVEINVRWDADSIELDPDTGLPLNLAWEELLFYVRQEGGPGYDYAAPLFTLPQTYEADLSTPVETPLTLSVPDDVSTKIYLVVRSQAAVGAEKVQSADSDEVDLTIDLTALAAFDFSVAYNDVADSIDLAWPAGDARVKEWAVYSGDASGGPWVELTRVAVGTGDTSISIPADSMFPAGVVTTKYFTMVAFGAYDVFSANAVEQSITRNRTTPAGVINLQIFLTQ